MHIKPAQEKETIASLLQRKFCGQRHGQLRRSSRLLGRKYRSKEISATAWVSLVEEPGAMVLSPPPAYARQRHWSPGIRGMSVRGTGYPGRLNILKRNKRNDSPHSPALDDRRLQ